jgi:hypothetical protein
LVPTAQLAERRPARNLPARATRDHLDQHSFIECCGRRHSRNR